MFDSECYTPNGISWLGSKILIRKNGENLFINSNHDTIFIKTNAKLEDNWVAYEFPDSMYIVASVIDHDTISFLGLKDSVKTIEFQVLDHNHVMIPHSVNGKKIQLSRSYGLISTLNFSLFPDLQPTSNTNDELEEYRIVGISNPRFGVQNLTWFDVYDFNVGDEVHILKTNNTFGPVNCTTFNESVKIIQKYLNRTESVEGINYTIERIRSIDKTWEDSIAFNYYQDTIQVVISANPTFDKLPEEPVILRDEVHRYLMENDIFITKIRMDESFGQYNDTCWIPVNYFGCVGNNKYIKGLGGPFYSCSGGIDCYQEINENPVYFKKGNVVWGTPLLINNIKTNLNVDKFAVYPNPATNQIFFCKSLTGSFSFELIDLQGTVLLFEKIDVDNPSIMLDDKYQGLFIYRITQGNTTITGKLLIL